MTLQFWFEFASTYSYPAAMRIEALAAERGVPLEWKPFLLGPIFSAQGWTDSPFNIYTAKGNYMWRDLERVCAQHALPLRRPSQFPRSGRLAARIALAAQGEPWVPAFVRAVYHANFALDQDITAPEVISGLLADLGLPAASLVAGADQPAAKEALRLQTAEAQSLGIFGAPSFLVPENDGLAELFWGNDRIEAAFDWYSRHGS